jgi:hypothetical protein
VLGHERASLLIPIDFSLHLNFGFFQYIEGIEVLHQLLEFGHKVSQMEEIPKIGMRFAGFNCGEAANFAIPVWLDVAREAAAQQAAMNCLPILSHQELLYLLAMSIASRLFSLFL